MSIFYELHVLLEKDGETRHLHVEIRRPKLDASGEGAYCRVRMNGLLATDKRIHGIDKEQAGDLAKQFVRSLLERMRLFDESGQPINLDQLEI